VLMAEGGSHPTHSRPHAACTERPVPAPETLESDGVGSRVGLRLSVQTHVKVGRAVVSVAESVLAPPGPIPNPVVTQGSAGEYCGGDPVGGEAAAGTTARTHLPVCSR
jgi:hypothetical protein